MPTTRLYKSVDEFSDLKLFKRIEGGAVYIQDCEDAFCVVIDESGVANLLPPEELNDVDLIKVLQFSSEQERKAYLTSRFGGKIDLIF